MSWLELTMKGRLFFSKLHAERAEVVKLIHGHLDDLQKAFIQLVHIPPVEHDDNMLMDRVQKMQIIFSETESYYSKNSIYFDLDTRKMMLDLLSNVHKILSCFTGTSEPLFIVDANAVVGSNYSDGMLEVMKKSLDAWVQQITVIRESLEGKFRELLGVS